MQLFGLLLAFLVGLSLVNLISPKFSLAIKIGFAFNLGLGIVTFGIYSLQLLGLKIDITSLIIWTLLLTALFTGLNYKNLKESYSINFQLPSLKQIHYGWLFFFGIICYILWATAQKGLFWPVVEYDSVNGYDFMGKAIAAEGTFKNSLIENADYVQNGRLLYPPLVSGSCAYAYLLGFESTKIIILLQFTSFAILFYGLLRQFSTAFASIMFTALMIATPEMLSHASLSLTNLPDAIYVGSAVICIYIWLQKREKPFLILGSVMMGLNMWTRTDGIAFLGAVGFILLIDAISNKTWKELIIYGIIAGLPFVLWSSYTKLGLNAGADALFVKHLFWDANKLSKIGGFMKTYFLSVSTLYGVTFVLFYLWVIINIKNIWQSKDMFVPLALLCWLFYTMIYYQMDNALIGVTLESFMQASYKRGVFCFVPIAWYYISVNKTSNWLFTKLDEVMNVQAPK